MKAPRSYNRQFNSLVKKAAKQLDCKVYDTVAISFGFVDSTVVGHDGCMGFTFCFEDQDVQLVRCDDREYKAMQGIHLNETDLSHLVDQIQVALRDNFQNIYIHSIKKAA